MHFVIEEMKDADWTRVREIYQEGIAGGSATFETQVPERPEWDRGHLHASRLVARKEGQVVGWAALTLVSERVGIWTLQGGIFPENQASVALHESCGFREVGRRERLSQLNGDWKDVIVMERRSKVV